MFYKISQSFTPKHQQPAFGTKLPNAKNKVFFLFLFFPFFLRNSGVFCFWLISTGQNTQQSGVRVICLCHKWTLSLLICVTSLMNDPLQVHVFLYLYYGLTAIGYQPTWKRRLTEMQIIQVIIFFVIILFLVTLSCRTLWKPNK